MQIYKILQKGKKYDVCTNPFYEKLKFIIYDIHAHFAGNLNSRGHHLYLILPQIIDNTLKSNMQISVYLTKLTDTLQALLYLTGWDLTLDII